MLITTSEGKRRLLIVDVASSPLPPVAATKVVVPVVAAAPPAPVVAAPTPKPVEKPVPPAVSVEQLQKELAILQKELAAKHPTPSGSKPEPKGGMTVAEAKVFVASFAGKRGRRPAAFHEAEEIIKAASA